MFGMMLLALVASGVEPELFAKEQRVASQVRDPNPFSKTGWKTTTTSTWSLVSLTRDGLDVAYDERLCGLETSRVHGATVHYPEAFVSSVPVRHHQAQLVEAGSELQFSAGPFVQVLGATEGEGALPEQAEDARVVDGDRDGKPGITVQVSQTILGSGEAYVAVRSVTQLDGWVQSDGSIVGEVEVADEQVVLDATAWWLKLDRRQRPHVDPGQSTFSMVPVSQQSDCRDVLDRREVLFARGEG